MMFKDFGKSYFANSRLIIGDKNLRFIYEAQKIYS